MNLTIPVSENWDFLDRGDTINSYQEEVLNQVIKEPVDFEVVRFGKIARNGITSILYQFNFFNFLTNTYENSYVVPNRLNSFENFNVVEVDTFYVSAKFFSGLDGTYTQFINVPQNELINSSEVDEVYFYYKYKLFYDKKEYTVFAPNSATEVPISSVFWYEFIS